MDKIKVGLIGVGMVGKTYALQLSKGLVEGAELAAVCCRERQMEWVKNNLPEQVMIFVDEDTFFNDSGVDAVMIATPHYSHPDLAKKAFAKGMHVLLEKPSGVYTKNVAEMNKVAALSGKVFSIMFNQRTNPLYQKVRNLIQSGEIGKIIRTNWTYTNCYRTQTYYDSSKWRATWGGEGGGVLINQAAHPLDLWQWITGLVPKQVQAFCQEGKFHQMEAEDAVTAYVEFENGATGIFIASTGEEFGTNRLEIVGDKGKIVVENQTISLFRSNPDPECSTLPFPVSEENAEHLAMTQNWIGAIIKGAPLLAPGAEGIKSLELTNAIYLSSWQNKTVALPIDEELYLAKLHEKIENAGR